MKRMRDWLQRELNAREMLLIVGMAVIGFAAGGWLLLRSETTAPQLEKKQERAWERETFGVVSIGGDLSSEQGTVLRDPFSRVHGERCPQSVLSQEVPAAREAASSGTMSQDKSRLPGGPIELKGILLSGTGDGMAVLAASGTQFSLQPGEEKHGIYLVSVQSTGVVIKSAGGERTLTIRQ